MTEDGTAADESDRPIRKLVLKWGGILGAIITIYSGTAVLLELAAWAQWIVSNWQGATFWLWNFILGWLPFTISQVVANFLTLAATLSGVIYATYEPKAAYNQSYWDSVPLTIMFLLCYIPTRIGQSRPIGIDDQIGFTFGAIILISMTALMILYTKRKRRLLRLWSILAGVAILMAMNEFSKLGLTSEILQAPA